MIDPYADIHGEITLPYTGKAKFKGMNPQFMDSFTQMATEYYARTGKQLQVDDAWRSQEAQAEGHRRKPTLVAPAGHSYHPLGLAMDLNTQQANELASMKDEQGQSLLEKYGFYRPMLSRGPGKKYEPWHIQMADFERKVGKISARIDPYADIAAASKDPYADISAGPSIAPAPAAQAVVGPETKVSVPGKPSEAAAVEDVSKMPAWRRRAIHTTAGVLQGMNVPWITNPIIRQIKNVTGAIILGGEDTEKGLQKVMSLTEEGAKKAGEEYGLIQRYGPEVIGSIGPYAAAGGIVTKAATKLPYLSKLMKAAGEMPVIVFQVPVNISARALA